MGDTTEHLTLIGFAARLGTCVSREECASDENDLRSEAQLLMNLLVSNPAPESTVVLEKREVVSPIFEDEPSCEQWPTPEAKKPYTFQFSCPSLSLDGKTPQPPNCCSAPPMRGRLASDDSEDSIPSLVDPPAPVVAMGRPLVVDDRDALGLSAEAMARNILRTFEKAVQWRKKCWFDTLARSLVEFEGEMKQGGASEEELRALLETPEAKVIASLNCASIDVLDARTSFRVLPQRWDKSEGSSETPPLKKRKVDVAGEEKSGEYSNAFVLSFQTVLNLSSPAGYSQVTLEAPGFIEGRFVSSPTSDVILTGVSVEIDTRVLATMIEKSSRIIARASAAAIIDTPLETAESDGEYLDGYPSTEELSLEGTKSDISTPSVDGTTESNNPSSFRTIVTPSYKSPPNVYCDSDPELIAKTCIPLPELPEGSCSAIRERSFLRMVSPQPGSSSSDESVDLDTPSLAMKRIGPSLISPPPSRYSANGTTEYLSFDSRAGPSLPALLEVACAAMRQAN